MNLKRFVNRLSRDCHVDIDREVSTAYFTSSSVFRLFNNRKKIRMNEEPYSIFGIELLATQAKRKMVKISVSILPGSELEKLWLTLTKDRTFNWEY